MNIPFFKGQRWISETEPELGLGLISAADNKYVEVLFLTHKTTRKYARASAPLKRIAFKAGDSIETSDGKRCRISEVETNPDGLITYICDSIRIPETDLADTISTSSPLQRFLHKGIDSKADFDLRSDLLGYQMKLLQSSVRGFVGGRISLLPHQIHIADKVATRKPLRALLADETGLGKTIEACLILHRLLTIGSITRILIIVPDHLIHQWFVELLRRFNLTFSLFTSDFVESLQDVPNPFLTTQTGICPISYPTKDNEVGSKLIEAEWDLVIIDEAHHLQLGSPQYDFVKRLSEKADGLILLSATPEQLGREDHFARLQLLDPFRYTSYEFYKNEISSLRQLYSIIEQNLASIQDVHTIPLDAITLDLPRSLVATVIEDSSVKQNSSNETITLSVEQIIDLFGTGRIMFRNTRKNISGFPKREVHIDLLEATKKEVAEINQEFIKDLNHNTHDDYKISFNDQRVTWLVDLIKNAKSKILIICSSLQKAIALQKAIQKNINIDIALFHEEMTILQRDRNAAWFADENGAPVLICSELGSEGRNFQFCQHLALFDLPLNPELLEQRIGRLDRIGQTNTIHLHIPIVKNSTQEFISKWYNDSLDAFRNNVPAAIRVFELVEQDIVNIVKSASDTTSLKDALLQKSQKLCTDFTEQYINARDRLFELISSHPQRANELIRTIETTDSLLSTEDIMDRLFIHYGLALDDAGGKKHVLLTEYCTNHAFPLPRNERPIITFDRATALIREDVEFITIDHPIVSGALDLFLSSDHGSSSFVIWQDANTKALVMEVVYIVECIAPSELNTSRFLPPTPLRLVIDHTGKDVTKDYSPAQIYSHSVNGSVLRFFGAFPNINTLLPKIFESCNALAEKKSLSIIESGVSTLNSLAQKDLQRLKVLQDKIGAPLVNEMNSIKNETEAILKHLKASRVRCDSLRVIYRGPETKKFTSEE